MRIFSKLYNRVIEWSRHRHAPYYLAAVSFAESSMFPVPPDVMLVSMSLVKPKNSWCYATLATIASVLGGILGYVIGVFLFPFVFAYFEWLGYAEAYHTVQHWFHVWGILVVFVAGFSPIPYKLFTIGAGAMQLALFPFIVASLIGRGLRFFLVAGAMYWRGERLHHLMHKYIDAIGWFVVGSGILLYLLWTFNLIKF